MKDKNEPKLIGTGKDYGYSKIPVSPDLACWGYYFIIMFVIIFVAIMVFAFAKIVYGVNLGIICLLLVFGLLPIVNLISEKLGIRSYNKRVEKFYKDHNKAENNKDG